MLTSSFIFSVNADSIKSSSSFYAARYGNSQLQGDAVALRVTSNTEKIRKTIIQEIEKRVVVPGISSSDLKKLHESMVMGFIMNPSISEDLENWSNTNIAPTVKIDNLLTGIQKRVLQRYLSDPAKTIASIAETISHTQINAKSGEVVIPQVDNSKPGASSGEISSGTELPQSPSASLSSPVLDPATPSQGAYLSDADILNNAFLTNDFLGSTPEILILPEEAPILEEGVVAQGLRMKNNLDRIDKIF